MILSFSNGTDGQPRMIQMITKTIIIFSPRVKQHGTNKTHLILSSRKYLLLEDKFMSRGLQVIS